MFPPPCDPRREGERNGGSRELLGLPHSPAPLCAAATDPGPSYGAVLRCPEQLVPHFLIPVPGQHSYDLSRVKVTSRSGCSGFWMAPAWGRGESTGTVEWRPVGAGVPGSGSRPLAVGAGAEQVRPAVSLGRALSGCQAANTPSCYQTRTGWCLEQVAEDPVTGPRPLGPSLTPARCLLSGSKVSTPGWWGREPTPA